MGRQYERTHPWVTFGFALDRLDPVTWMLLGEAESKCEHIAGAPLLPVVAQKLHEVYLSKGIHATTSIEGNSLSENQVLARVQGDLPLPPSMEYLGTEIDNILGLCNEITNDVVKRKPLILNPGRIAHFNKRILAELPVQDDVVPGVTRSHSVVVGNYRGVPAEDVDYLMDRLCTWLDSEFTVGAGEEEYEFTLALLKAILAHLYIAWIHPFGDGNGRTARIIEFQLLIQAGVPSPAAHLLSNHYNLTRDAYYRTLARTSKGDFPVQDFVKYAVRGFVDQLHEQIDHIRQQQQDVTWEYFVHEEFSNQETTAKLRQKHLVLDLPKNDAVPVNSIRHVSPRIAEEYAGKGQKTVSRDLNELAAMGLIRRVGKGGRLVVANRATIRAFLPVRAARTRNDEDLG